MSIFGFILKKNIFDSVFMDKTNTDFDMLSRMNSCVAMCMRLR